MRLGVWLHQFDNGYPGRIGWNDRGVPISAIIGKTHDGLNWQATWDHGVGNPPIRIDGLDAIERVRDMYAAQGIAYVPWCVPHGRWEGAAADYAVREGERAGQVALAARAPGTPPRIILDLEPYYHAPFPAFWRNDLGAGEAEINQFCYGFAQTVGAGGEIDVAPDARLMHLPPITFAQWTVKLETRRVHPQIYFTDFVAPRPATEADARAAVDAAINALGVNLWGRLDTICPIFPGDAAPAVLIAAIDYAHSLGLGRPSIWQRANTSPETFQAIADHVDPWGPSDAPTIPGPEPLPAPIDVAAIRTGLDVIERLVASARDHDAAAIIALDTATHQIGTVRALLPEQEGL